MNLLVFLSSLIEFMKFVAEFIILLFFLLFSVEEELLYKHLELNFKLFNFI